MPIDIENYQNLAHAIVKLALADFVDYLIIQRQGYLDWNDFRYTAFTKCIKYGNRRYVWKDKHGKMHRRQRAQIVKDLNRLKEVIDLDANKANVAGKVVTMEAFIRSRAFANLMPDTDIEWLIETCKKRADRGERIITGYDKSEGVL